MKKAEKLKKTKRKKEYAVMVAGGGTSLAEAQTFVRDNMAHGVICPACGQIAKIYPRTITAMMAYALALIDRRLCGSNEFLHVTTYLLEIKMLPNVASAIRADWPKLRHWQLLEAASGTRADGSDRVGNYRITDRGRAFVRGALAVPKHLYIYNNRVLEVVSTKPVKMITFRDTFGKRFHFDELMGNLPGADAFKGVAVHNPLVDVTVDTEHGTLFAA